MSVQLTDADILVRLTAVEDATVERKTLNDIRDCVEAACAFSNSLPSGGVAVIFYGVRDDGSIEDNRIAGFESFQKKVTKELLNIYPPIYPELLVREKDGKHFLAIVVFASENTPHFVGKSFIRKGTETFEASEQQFDELVAKRSNKSAHILKWKGKIITVDWLNPEEISYKSGRVSTTGRGVLNDCNNFYVSVKFDLNMASYTLRRVEISYDHDNERLKLEIYPM